MRHKDVIELLSITIVEDDLNNQIEQEVPRPVFANEFDIGATEYYSAGAQGLKPEKRFEIYAFEYRGETKFKYNGNEYTIIRTQTKGEKIRLTGEKKNG
ncbi:phage head closure protein [Halalkalibacter sp. APA_J-10(15)]|uniref:phage head closure protein n=1 Tax=Halalkalibacter sp. APA_J-10(15) TaxID=2933805 RepID=UPI001FF2131B|nr:phage head closure protein [Halalkalibacter sp. APA_J-10(15)]MCK0471396.1 phage head closure protein [Halalkalibacter sp. APA_J-10(15)]